MTAQERAGWVSARAALRSMPHIVCQCYGQPGHLPRCPVGMAERAIELIDRVLDQDKAQLTLALA